MLRTVLKRDARGRPVKTAPFARRRQAHEGDLLKQAIRLGAEMAESEARHMLARKARQVSADDKAVDRLIAKGENEQAERS